MKNEKKEVGGLVSFVCAAAGGGGVVIGGELLVGGAAEVGGETSGSNGSCRLLVAPAPAGRFGLEGVGEGGT